jgi:AraC-like DNA-binding protein
VKSSESGTLPELLSQSQILRDYERAFSDATGLPLAFTAVGRKRPGMRTSKNANAFCRQMAETDPGCRMCVDMQTRLTADCEGNSRSAQCVAGLVDSVIPVRVGEKLLGFLQTGQVALRQLQNDDFRRVLGWLQESAAETDWQALEAAYFQTPVLTRERYDAILRLLEVFAQHLSIAAEQIATQQANDEPPLIARARQVIEERSSEDLTLEEIARTVHTSTFHFCKIFKRATGLTFTQYLSMVRVAKAKKLLANPQARISEVAYEAGFASLTHFNRLFRRIAGQSPTEFRQKLPNV